MPDAHAPPPDPQPAADPRMRSTATLFDLVATALDRMERDGTAALEELCREHPQHAERLRTRIAQLGAFGLAGDAPSDGVPERLGQFRLLARLGGGGMGVVYEAEQDGLQRRVALKLVRPGTLYFPGARERFRREVEVLARLQHPGIVPVYAGGEERGVPYLAMELVRGATLDEALRELPAVSGGREPARLLGRDLLAAVNAVVARRDAEPRTPPRESPRDSPPAPSKSPSVPHASSTGSRAASSAAGAATAAVPALYAGSWVVTCTRLARRVAEALAHAQAQGVLHRDIKPSNVMLTPEGRVLMLDFGLASAEGSVRLTASAQGLGSPAYMSPEQVRGERGAVDARSDVWSLGVTLYEALTLHQPFATADLQHTARLVLAAHPPAPRARNPSVPADLETVVLAAMEREPARRYAGPAELARDLSNVLELRPITVRPPSAARRLLRWTQRRPALATACVLGGLLLVAGPLGWELKRRESLETVLAARDQAERNFEAALGAIGHVLRGYATDGLEDVPRMQRAQLAAIDRALELFPQLEHDRPDDEAVLAERAELHLSRGDILRDLGRPEEAAPEFEVVIALRRRLFAQHEDGVHATLLAAALDRAAKLRFALGRPAEALPLYAEGIALLRRACAGDAVGARDPGGLGDTRPFSGTHAAQVSAAGPIDPLPPHAPGGAGSAKDAIGADSATSAIGANGANGATSAAGAAGAAGADGADGGHAGAHDHSEWRHDLALGLANFAETLRELDRTDEARAALDEALALAERERDAKPGDGRAQWTVGRVCSDLATLLRLGGDAVGALPWAQAALQAHRAARAAEPESRFDAFDVATSHAELATCLLDLGRLQDAAADARAGLALLDELLRDYPDVLRYHEQRSRILEMLGIAAARSGRTEEAVALLTQRVDESEALCRLAPERTDLALECAQALNNLAAVGLEAHLGVDELLAFIGRAEEHLVIANAGQPARGVASSLQTMLAYGRARALCMGDRLQAARAAAEAFEAASEGDGFRLRYAADLWNEYLLALRRADPQAAAEQAEATERLYELLGRALDAGYADRAELASTASLDSLREEPEFKALIARLPVSP